MKEDKSLMTFDSQAAVLEETRKQRQELMNNLKSMKNKVKKYIKDVENSDFKELDNIKKRRLDMLVSLTKLSLQIVDSELKVINSSVDSEVAYKSLMVEVLKLKEQLDEKENKPKYTFGNRTERSKPKIR